MSQLQLKDLFALTKKDIGSHISDGQSVQGEVRLLKDSADSSANRPPVSVHFKLLYRFASKLQKIYLGAWPANTLSDIRTQRDFYRGLLAQESTLKPRSPGSKNFAASISRLRTSFNSPNVCNSRSWQATSSLLQKRRERQTYRQFFEQDFFPNTLKLGRADGGEEVKRSFEKDVFPIIGDVALEDVCKEHLKLILDTIGQRATKTQNMVRTKKKVLRRPPKPELRI